MKNKNEYHSISSSSDDDVVDKTMDETKENYQAVIQEQHQDTEDQVKTILSQKKNKLLNFNSIDKEETLFAEDITEDDEIWIVQTPAMVGVPMNKVSINFDSPVSKVKFKINGSRTPFNVHTITDASPTINFLLPSKETKSFRPKTYPLSGKIFLQQTLKVGEVKKDTEPM